MTRFVELPTSRDSSVWVNPDHIVSVEAHYTEGSCWVVTEMGCRTHIPLSQEAVVACLHDLEVQVVDPSGLSGWTHAYECPHCTGRFFPVCDRPRPAPPEVVDVRDSVRENLTR